MERSEIRDRVCNRQDPGLRFAASGLRAQTKGRIIDPAFFLFAGVITVVSCLFQVVEPITESA
jgi:hypothetical protein